MELNEQNLNSFLSSDRFALFDTHAHLTDEAFDFDRNALFSSFPYYGVRHVVEAACKETDFEKVLRLCDSYPDTVYGALGIHPEHADTYTVETPAKIRSALSPRIVAIGEIGLDYHYDDGCPKELQKKCFSEQIALSKELHLPVIIHDRDAHGDCMDILRSEKNGLRGVMHCFSGSYETAAECLSLGLYIGVGGSSTFKNSRKLKEIIPKLPLDRILIETDCPYMTPEPFRGQRNDSRLCGLTLRRIAELRNENLETVAETCYANACSLFSVRD